MSKTLAATLACVAAFTISAQPAPGTLATIDKAPLLSIGVEDGEEMYELHRVYDAFRFADGRISISNGGSNDIRLFDAKGKYLKSIGRKGAGPGEFSEMSNPKFYPVGDSILSNDANANRLHVFGPDMKFMETRVFTVSDVAPRPFMAGVFGDGTLSTMAFVGGGRLSGEPGAVLRSQYALLHYSAKGRMLNRITDVEAQPRYVLEFGNSRSFPYIPLVAEPLHAVSDNEIFLMRGAKPEIEVFDASGKLIRTLKWAHALKKSSEVWEAYKRADLAAETGAQRAKYEKYYSLKLPLPEFAPSYSEMLVDSQKRLWLRRYEVDASATGPVWDVLSRTGTLLGSVQTPAHVRVFRVGTDYLLGRHSDDLGVERVQVYRMQLKAR